jgi:hypothetical protein
MSKVFVNVQPAQVRPLPAAVSGETRSDRAGHRRAQMIPKAKIRVPLTRYPMLAHAFRRIPIVGLPDPALRVVFSR